jgi:hypothetical protein
MFEDSAAAGQLVESHGALVAQLGALEELAHHLRGCPGASAFTNLAESVTALRSRLEEHMAREERDIYPNLVAKLGSMQVESMLDDHREIRRWVDKLVRARVRFERGELDLEPVRWSLYVVIGAVGLHLRKEELAYLRLASQQVELPAG